MQWDKKYIYRPEYEYTGSNQHGDRFRRNGHKKLTTARLSCDCTSCSDMQKLILLSHTLDVPVRYDFNAEPQQAYIEVVSAEQV